MVSAGISWATCPDIPPVLWWWSSSIPRISSPSVWPGFLSLPILGFFGTPGLLGVLFLCRPPATPWGELGCVLLRCPELGLSVPHMLSNPSHLVAGFSVSGDVARHFNTSFHCLLAKWSPVLWGAECLSRLADRVIYPSCGWVLCQQSKKWAIDRCQKRCIGLRFLKSRIV